MKISVGGFDNLISRIGEIQSGLGDLDGEHTISFEEMFPPNFMKNYTDFDSIGDMMDESGFSVETSEDFEKIPDDDWDKFVSNRTRFSTWSTMLDKATKQWISNVLGLS